MSRAYVVGTFDTKSAELRYIADRLAAAGVPVLRVDVGTQSDGADADVPPPRSRAIIRTVPEPCSGGATAARR